jgi:isopentenyldiphosphate isomerase
MGDHLIDVVDDTDNVIGKELKSKKPELGFISRVVAVMIRDSEGKLLVCKRGSHKKVDADRYDLAAFGNVDSGEDYETAASRELQEELNMSCNLTFLGKAYQENIHKGIKFRIFCSVFLGHSDDEPELNHEVVGFRRMTLEEIEHEMANEPDKFCQGFRNDYELVKHKLKEL